THYLEEAERLCRRIAIIRSGKIVTEKPTEELVAAGESLQDVFLELTRN
ncbi:MAG: ABC transporter ATP-binding protein, partial [Candidatus Eremiobacteraeota bacterium]|nr:ABC transporter ATP-binding protein [Candidatus Eremiobacteraeota bacterium]MBV9264183.1 ABC transporter ATP-binding protein [Candidatus Eremiobacteraeota bacterium]